MRLSVIIPCLVRDEWVERAIRSIGPSVPDVEVELVVVEGVRPLGRARNVGLDRATGDYLAWIDGDDEVTSDWLSSIGRALADAPGTDVLVLGLHHEGWDGRKDVVWTVPCGRADPRRLLADVYHNISMSGNQVLYVTRRELWHDLRFDEDILIGEDYLMAPRLLRRAKSCLNIGRALYRYHCNAGSLMAEMDADKERDWRRIQVRRLEEAEPCDRRAAVWGVAADCYWKFDLAALKKRETENAAYGRRWIRRHFLSLLVEAVCGRGLSPVERLSWTARFICAATNCGWLLRLKARGAKT